MRADSITSNHVLASSISNRLQSVMSRNNFMLHSSPFISINSSAPLTFFFFTDTATTEIYTLSLHDALPIPVVSTAFRPLDRAELAANPFRVFTSVLVPEDRRFFGADLEGRLKNFLDARQIFPPELLALADRAIEHGELSPGDADRYQELAAASFALSPEPVDRSWYTELERVSAVAADIGGVTTTHINHLTPRVLDIDDLYASMRARGIEMIDEIQGPPRWKGPDVLLRQTSFRALSEPRMFRDPDG